MVNKGPHYNRDRITDEAAEWLVRAGGSEMTVADRKSMADWLMGSAEHVREYLQLASMTMDIRELENQDAPSAEALIDLAQNGIDDSNVFHFNKPTAKPTIKQSSTTTKTSKQNVWKRIPVLSVAAAAVLVVFSALFYQAQFSAQVYSTGLGQQASFPLEDGSVVTLNAQSRIEVDYSDEHRSITFLQGEALFVVAKNKDRPFVVMANKANIQAIGTAFNVRHRKGDTAVTVVEGIIEVKPQSTQPGTEAVRVSIGQQVRMKKTGVVDVRTVDVDKAMLWQERRLHFEDRNLADVIEEFNFYHQNRLIIQDQELALRKISGSFYLDDPKSFVKFLQTAGVADSIVLSNGTIALRSIKNNIDKTI